jgi:hypothetical protein
MVNPFALITLAYLCAAGLAVTLTLWKARGLKRKLVFGALVLALFAIWPVSSIVDDSRREANERATLDVAKTHFEMRCKSAGEKISRTVENVEGVVWMKWRDRDSTYRDQFTLDDPLGRDCGAEDCIAQLLKVSAGQVHNPERAARYSVGYRFVDSKEHGDGALMRYTRVIQSVRTRTPEQIEQYKKNTNGVDPGPDVFDVALASVPIDNLGARYGITWDDISTREDREHWVAGSSLKVVDLKTNEVIAERIGYLIDTGQGSTAGFRDPWGWAKTYAPRCPKTNESTREFANKVLQPIK